MAASLIRDALANAQQELAKKRSHPSPAPSSSASSSSSSSSSTAHKKPKTSHSHRPSSSSASHTGPSHPSSASGGGSTASQSIKDAIAASRSELDAKRQYQHSKAAAPPTKPLSPYERFISDHWDDDEYDGLSADERRAALNRRFEAVSFSKKEAWTSEWNRELDAWEADMQVWEGRGGGSTADNGGASSASSSSSSRAHASNHHSHKPAPAPRTTKPSQSSAASSSTHTSAPSSSSTVASTAQPHLVTDYSPSPLVSQHYSGQSGQISLLPYVNKHSKAYLTLTFPLTRISQIISLLPTQAAPTQRPFPQLTVATISRAIDYFIQHVSALVLASAVADGSRVLRPEDYRTVIMRRAELWWLRWAQEDDRDVRGRYRTGQLAAVEKKRRDAEDRARGRIIKGDDGEQEGGEGGEEEGGAEDGMDEDGSAREMDDRGGAGQRVHNEDSRMEDQQDEDEDENEDNKSEASPERRTQRPTSAADEDDSVDMQPAAPSPAKASDERAAMESASPQWGRKPHGLLLEGHVRVS